MAAIHFSLEHGRSLGDAQALLAQSVDELQRNFHAVVERVEWSADRNGARIVARGFEVAIRVDDRAVHVEAEVPLWARWIGSSAVDGLKRLLQRNIQNRIPS